jgi:hypothetical protein
MKFTMTVDMDNAAFRDDYEPGNELAAVLRRVIQDVQFESEHRLLCLSPAGILDSNGNRVGSWEITA